MTFKESGERDTKSWVCSQCHLKGRGTFGETSPSSVERERGCPCSVVWETVGAHEAERPLGFSALVLVRVRCQGWSAGGRSVWLTVTEVWGGCCSVQLWCLLAGTFAVALEPPFLQVPSSECTH